MPAAKKPSRHISSSERGTERYQAIIEAAVARIGEVGMEGFRVRDVADEVGINNATLHYYFPTKEDLIVAVVVALTTRLSALHRNSVETTQPKAKSTLEKLKRHADVFYRELRRSPQTFAVMTELMVRANRDRDMATTLKASQDAWRAFLGGLLSGEAQSGAVAARKAERMADQLITFIFGELLQLSCVGLLNARAGTRALEASQASTNAFLENMCRS